MKITKLVHSCLLVETPQRTALFDPGSMSEALVAGVSLEHLDDIVITHSHQDHFHLPLVKGLVQKFPDVIITATVDIAQRLADEGITAQTTPAQGMNFFDSPHEDTRPLGEPPEEIGVHYLDLLTHPGDSHHFTETKAILALPMTAPWGSMINAVRLALELKPQYIVPIHDWHWRDEALEQMYAKLEAVFQEQGIDFIRAVDGEAFTIDA